MSYRYIGNKTRIADWIVGIVARTVPPGSIIADPMCGTAAMSAAFAAAEFRIVASDALRFPVLHARARLLSELPMRFAGFGLNYEQAIVALNGLQPTNGLFHREYSASGKPANGTRPRQYFTGENAARIDAMRAAIKTWRTQGLDALAADLLLHDLILAANRVANIAGTYGFYRAGWSSASLAPLRLVPTRSDAVGGGHNVLHGKAEAVLRQVRADAVYLDPPYTKRQYGGNYHIPETLAQEDEPIPAGAGGLRDWTTQASDFCYRRRAPRAFRSVLDSCSASKVFISYSEDAHLIDSELETVLEDYGRWERHDRPLDRFRSNGRVARRGTVREYLYVLEMNNVGSA
jgi:adenine-specific DNA-methyltransferase